MKKFRYQSLWGLCFIFLFAANFFLVLIASIAGRAEFALLAILLSIIQFSIHRRFERKASVWRTFSFTGFMNHLVKLHFPFFSKRLTRISSSDRTLIRKRASNVPTALIFQADLGEEGSYEYLIHYREGVPLPDKKLRVNIGTDQCLQPYSMSILNGGSTNRWRLSQNSIFALSEGAKIEGFAVGTGWQGLQPAHIRGGGDLIWQFTLNSSVMRNFSGSDEELSFKKNAGRSYIKMIEFALKQVKKGTGQGRGFINRSSEPKDDRVKATEVLLFMDELRRLSGGKPIGLRSAFLDDFDLTTLCRAVHQTGITPDFITIDEHLFACQTPAFDAYSILASAKTLFQQYGIQTALIYSGNIITELDILKAVSLGACGCISTGPIDYACQPGLLSFRHPYYGKSMRIANFHRNTVAATAELMELCRYSSLADVKPERFYYHSLSRGSGTLADLYFPDRIWGKTFVSIANN